MKIIITESQLKSIIHHPHITPEIIEYVKTFKSDEDLLRSGGIPTELLDIAAFGFDDSLNEINPKDLHIKWKEDYENVLWEVKKSGLSPEQWSTKINLNKPIDVFFEDLGHGNKFYIEDGHHRYFAAKTLKKILKMTLEIKVNPIVALGGHDYDLFHRQLWRKVN